MSQPAPQPTILETVRALADRVHELEDARGGKRREECERVSSGCAAWDRLLPQGGLRRGTLVEWIAGGPGSGVATLALIAAREAAREDGAVVVLDRRQWFYPPAAAGLGLALDKLIVVRATGEEDEAWALDQALRSRGVAAVLGWPERFDDHTFRRLQLAAETSGALGLLVRPPGARSEPSWSDLRIAVEPISSHLPQRLLRVELLRSRGGQAGAVLILQLDESGGTIDAAQTPALHLASPVAAAKAAGRSTRA